MPGLKLPLDFTGRGHMDDVFPRFHTDDFIRQFAPKRKREDIEPLEDRGVAWRPTRWTVGSFRVVSCVKLAMLAGDSQDARR